MYRKANRKSHQLSACLISADLFSEGRKTTILTKLPPFMKKLTAM